MLGDPVKLLARSAVPVTSPVKLPTIFDVIVFGSLESLIVPYSILSAFNCVTKDPTPTKCCDAVIIPAA